MSVQRTAYTKYAFSTKFPVSCVRT